MISPQASVRFLPIYSKKFYKPHCRLQFHFSLAPPLNPSSSSKKRGTLEILPFSKNCVFDCIDKLCRHPVDPILRSFCWTQLKSLQKEKKTQFITFNDLTDYIFISSVSTNNQADKHDIYSY